jgi:hypothetical protein
VIAPAVPTKFRATATIATCANPRYEVHTSAMMW